MAEYKIRNKETGEIFTIREKEPEQKATAYTEVVSPLLSGASSAAFGVPKWAVGKIGGEQAIEKIFPEQQTAGGKALRIGAEGAGIVLGGAGRLGTSVAGKVIPQAAKSGLGLLSKVGDVEKFRRTKMLSDVGRASIAGGVAGSTQILNPDTDIENQAIQGLTGAAGGAILSSTYAGGKGLFNSLRKSAMIGKPSGVGSQKIARGQLSQRIGTLVDNVNRNVAGASEKLNQTTQEIADSLKNTTKIFEENLKKAAEKGLVKFQEFVPKYFKETTRTYGETLDGMIDGLSGVKNTQGQFVGKNIPVEQANGVLAKVQQEATEIGIQDSPVLTKVRELVAKYTDKKFVDVKEFLTDIRSARDSISSGAKSGNQYLSHKDMSSAILNDNVGEFLTEFLPDGQLGSFKDLQSAYKSIINAKKLAYKTFQPSLDELGGTRGFNLLKKLGEKGVSGMTPQEMAFIDAMEKGSVFGKGAGRVTKTLRGMKTELIKKQTQAGVDKETAEKAFKRFTMLAESRKYDIARRGLRVSSIEEATKQADAIKNALAIGGAALSIGAGGVAIMRGLGAEKQIQQIGN